MLKPTLFHVTLRHEEVLDEIPCAAQVLPQLVEAVLAGVWVEQAVFDAVLAGLNQVAGTQYTQDDLREVHILTDADPSGVVSEARHSMSNIRTREPTMRGRV